MAKVPFWVGDTALDSKAAVRRRIQEIVADNGEGARLEGEQFEFMLAVFRRHPRSALKLGRGVDFIEIRRSQRNPNNLEFWIREADTRWWTDISWTECLTPTTPKNEFWNACRLAVKPSTTAFADAVLAARQDQHHRLRCPETGVWFTRAEADVHHIPPNTFDAIVGAFVDEERIDTETLEYTGFQHGSTYVELADRRLRERFVRFHDHHAELVVLSREGHRRIRGGTG